MQRRSFFGVLGGLFAGFLAPRQEAAKPVHRWYRLQAVAEPLKLDVGNPRMEIKVSTEELAAAMKAALEPVLKDLAGNIQRIADEHRKDV